MSSSAPAKILFVVPQPFFVDRGSPFRVKATVTALNKVGREVDLLVLAPGAEIDIPGVTIHRTLPLPGVKNVPIGPSMLKVFFDLLLFLKASQLILTRRYAAMHGVEEGGVIVAFWGKLLRVPYVFDMHSWMSEALSSTSWGRIPGLVRALSMLERCCLKSAAGIITVGEEHAQKMRVLSNGKPVFAIEDLPLEQSSPSGERSVIQLRERYNLLGRKVAVYTGNFEGYQGIDLLLEAWKELVTEQGNSLGHPKFTLVLVGGGEEGTTRFEFYRNRVRELGIEQSVVFTGQLPGSEMDSFMELADVLVSPRVSRPNTPLKIYCYMAAKRPIVATRISSHTQVLSDDCAFLALPDARSFARALAAALALGSTEAEHRTVSSRVAEAARLIETKYSRAEFQRRVSALYELVLGRT